ncbi:MAG: alpha-hydroxy acid oxidase [Candidatus Lutacidiplasmatales archaeon]
MEAATTGGFRTLRDLEEAGRRRCSPAVWAFVQGGAGEERALERNRTAFGHHTVRPHVLTGVDRVDLSTRLLGQSVNAPFFASPTAYQGLLHPDGELATARAAASAGVLAAFSTLSSHPLEEIARAGGPAGGRWFQLYVQPDFAETQRLVQRAETAGFKALVLTADVPVLGVRDRQAEGGIALDFVVPVGNGPNIQTPVRQPERSGSEFTFRSASSTWALVDRLREVTRLPIVVKGILTAEDALKAVEHGAAAVVVSNHGGRQLDAAPATIDVLSSVVHAVGARCEVYLDGGVRRADDVLIALSLGARAVGLGRPVLWALSAGGEAGVARLFSLLSTELAIDMALVGRRRISDIDATLLGP